MSNSPHALSIFPSNTLSHPHALSNPTPPTHPLPVLTSSWPPGMGSLPSVPAASPKPPGLRLGLIWTLCHPVSIHHPHIPILSSLPPPLPKRLWFKILYCEPPLHLQCLSACCQLQLFPPAPHPQPILKQILVEPVPKLCWWGDASKGFFFFSLSLPSE